ncbi:choline dehydrogenase-like flavoprotein [Amaricoccus macauensis]|uniref:Choline dehydrogenase-like flavoprotein n=1 Tax=Amaricoccus macauensis TaxID=57001 RepID=A0A840SDY8_9RHOB|nr:choline dehydrogenase-like flavoprotein [Amaricoccus macauensis]
MTGALYVDRDTNRLHFQKARVVILAANGIGTPRLLLASDNLANASDQVGRNLMHHTLVAGEIFVDEPVEGHTGYTASSLVNKWHQGWDVENLLIIDGSVLATGGVVNPTPTISALALRAAGHVRDHFADLSKASKSRVSAWSKVGFRACGGEVVAGVVWLRASSPRQGEFSATGGT